MPFIGKWRKMKMAIDHLKFAVFVFIRSKKPERPLALPYDIFQIVCGNIDRVPTLLNLITGPGYQSKLQKFGLNGTFLILMFFLYGPVIQPNDSFS